VRSLFLFASLALWVALAPSGAAAQAGSSASGSASASESESARESASESESESGSASTAHGDAVSAAVFPRPPPAPPEDPDPELDEPIVAPPPEPEWRLRLGVGASAATAGGPVLSFRLEQELEWMPPEAAPILFAITGGEVLGDYTMGLAGARLGLYGLFCRDRIVTCTGAVALRAGAIFGTLGTAFDLGGDGDARFRFDGVELAVRVGFFVIQGATFVDLVGMFGAAF